MKRMIFLLLVTFSVFMSGCAGLTRESICNGIELSNPIGIANPLMLGCLATDAVVFGMKVADDISGNASRRVQTAETEN